MFFWGGIPTIFGAGFTGFEDLQDNTEEEWQDVYFGKIGEDEAG